MTPKMQWPCLYMLTLHQKLVSALMMIPHQMDILVKLKMIYYMSNHICLPDLLFAVVVCYPQTLHLQMSCSLSK